jgi:phosphoglycolate phosphatase
MKLLHAEFTDFLPRADVSHVIFDFDGTLSWLRHGWPQMMLDIFLQHAPAGWNKDAILRTHLLSDILSLNGNPSIHQMQRLCERLRAAGETAPDPEHLLEQYQCQLRAVVRERTAGIQSGKSPASEFIIWNARQLLELLRARGAMLIVLSGTIENEVRSEAELLGISGFFGSRIYGSQPQGAFSKKDVIDRIMREERIEGYHLLAFGDGPVEIQFTKAVGGLAIGVASDEGENGLHKSDSTKREQLLRAGADAIIPDYAEADALLTAIFAK